MYHQLSQKKNLFPLLVKSICPSIFGNDLVKIGMLLSLFGGTDLKKQKKGKFTDFIFGSDEKPFGKNHSNDDDFLDSNESLPSIRPDIHMLIVGDPGLGKS
jgi:DNA helicase MCM8